MKKFLTLTLALAFGCSGFAKTFDVDVSTGRPAAANEAYYHGETIEFRAVRGSAVVTNITYGCIYYQTNGMDQVWWKTDGLVFHPTNDVGAASYRFFMEGRDEIGRDWHANGTIRMLPSPGFTPSAIELPVRTLDFATVEVSNAPWLEEETDPNVPGWAKVARPPYLTEHQQLSARYTEWTVTPSTVMNPNEGEAVPVTLAWEENGWHFFDDGYMTFDEPSSTDPAATNVAATIYGTPVVATRQALPGYQLGSDTNHILAAQSDLSALAAEVPRFAQAATNYTDAATNGLLKANEISSWAKAATKPSYTASEVGATTAEDVYRLIAGTNVVLVVTNYNSATHAPSMKLQHLDPQSGEYVTYWDETRRHGMTLTNAMHYTDAAIGTCAPAAWSGTTSGLGAEAPAGVTWISTPETVIAGGYEYEKVVTSAGAVWVLTSNGLYTGPTTNSYFRVAAADGTELFSIEKTDSYLVGVNADGITTSGNTVTIPFNVVASEHPYLRASRTLVNADWVKETENGFSCPWASVSWSGTTGAYVATITTSEPQAFFYFEYLVEGSAKIKNSAKTDLSGGIIFNGTTYFPAVNGNKLEFVAP